MKKIVRKKAKPKGIRVIREVPDVVETTATEVTKHARADAPSYPAFMVEQGAHRLFVTTIPVDDLYPYIHVSAREKDPKNGYQRVLNQHQAEEIAAYLNLGKCIPNALVLSARPEAELTYASKNKSITFARVPRAFFALDGQHRLHGFHLTSARNRLIVVIKERSTVAEEAQIFLDINTKQRGVSKALISDVRRIAESETARQAILCDLYDRLASDRKSPLHGRLSPLKPEKGKFTRPQFETAVGPLLKTGPLAGLDAEGGIEARYGVLRNYFAAILAEIPADRVEWFFTPALLGAFCRVLDDVVRRTMAVYQNCKTDSFVEVVRPLATLDFTLGGKPNLKLAVEIMQTALRDEIHITKDLT